MCSVHPSKTTHTAAATENTYAENDIAVSGRLGEMLRGVNEPKTNFQLCEEERQKETQNFATGWTNNEFETSSELGT